MGLPNIDARRRSIGLYRLNFWIHTVTARWQARPIDLSPSLYDSSFIFESFNFQY